MERPGCFVFHMEGPDPVPVRSQPSTCDECIGNISFARDELVAADLIRVNNEVDTFLRLSDGTGWILHHEDIMKSLHVESELFAMVVDHYPAGLTARSHPNERDEFRIDNVFYRPLEKVFCDKKVTHPDTGCHFYRVQGTHHWVFDRKYDSERKVFDTTLLEDHHVTVGDFAFIALTTVPIRSIPKFAQEFKTGLDIRKGEMITVNVIRDSPEGPWLRLSCGTGWVPEAYGRKSYFEQLGIERNSWSFRILNHPIGIQLRSHPLDERDEKLVDKKSFDDRLQVEFPKLPVLIEPEKTVDCDCKIVSPSTGVCWYRVVESKGWILDRRNGRATVEPYKRPSKKSQDATSSYWAVDFIRGMASMIEGLEEVRHNDMDYVILFQKGELQIKIWYKLRTVTVFVDRPKQGRIQMTRKDCAKQDLIEVLRNPKHLVMGKVDPAKPESPRSTTDFFDRQAESNRQDEGDDDHDKIDQRRYPLLRNAAVMRYGARYHKPHLSKMRSIDESLLAIKGTRQNDPSYAFDDSSLAVKMPSNHSFAGSIATTRAYPTLRNRLVPISGTADSYAIRDSEDEFECRQDLMLLDTEIQFLCEERRHLIDALRSCEIKRSSDASRFQQQCETIQRKLEPLLEPGLMFWGPTFGVWRCDKCKEECSDRHTLLQHVKSTGH